ncbi:MAG: hypothetical protein AAFV93_22655 [Chloroflexota bacterium]
MPSDLYNQEKLNDFDRALIDVYIKKTCQKYATSVAYIHGLSKQFAENACQSAYELVIKKHRDGSFVFKNQEGLSRYINQCIKYIFMRSPKFTTEPSRCFFITNS